MEISFSSDKHKRTVTRSFRLDETTSKIIENAAVEQGVTTNTLVNQVLTKYAKIDRYSAKARSIRLTEDVVKEIFDSVSEERLVEIGRRYGKGITFNNQILTLTGGFSTENIIQFLKFMADISTVNYTEVNHGDKTTISFMHNISYKYSVFFANVLAATFESAGSFPKILMDDRVVSFEFPVH